MRPEDRCCNREIASTEKSDMLSWNDLPWNYQRQLKFVRLLWTTQCRLNIGLSSTLKNCCCDALKRLFLLRKSVFRYVYVYRHERCTCRLVNVMICRIILKTSIFSFWEIYRPINFAERSFIVHTWSCACAYVVRMCVCEIVCVCARVWLCV